MQRSKRTRFEVHRLIDRSVAKRKKRQLEAIERHKADLAAMEREDLQRWKRNATLEERIARIEEHLGI